MRWKRTWNANSQDKYAGGSVTATPSLIWLKRRCEYRVLLNIAAKNISKLMIIIDANCSFSAINNIHFLSFTHSIFFSYAAGFENVKYILHIL